MVDRQNTCLNLVSNVASAAFVTDRAKDKNYFLLQSYAFTCFHEYLKCLALTHFKLG